MATDLREGVSFNLTFLRRSFLNLAVKQISKLVRPKFLPMLSRKKNKWSILFLRHGYRDLSLVVNLLFNLFTLEANEFKRDFFRNERAELLLHSNTK